MKMDKRMVLNYIMMLMLFPLMVKPLIGIFAHEIMGAGLALLTVVHCLNNRGWAKSMLRALREKDGVPKKLGTLVINSLLLVSVVFVATSGMMISIVIFGLLNIPYYEIFYKIHTTAAQSVLLLSLVHLFMHAKMIIAFFRRRKQERRENTI